MLPLFLLLLRDKCRPFAILDLITRNEKVIDIFYASISK